MPCMVRSCQKALSERSARFCEEHLTQYKLRAKECRDRKKAKGQCLNCKRPRLPDRPRCERCLQKRVGYRGWTNAGETDEAAGNT